MQYLREIWKRMPWLILAIIPLVYVTVGFYFNELIGLFSARTVDPEYVYLTNGVYMSLGHANVMHIDNPGTPLQVLVAIVCRVVYFFRSTETPYLEDVFTNSDLYLNICNHVANVTMAAALYVGGLLARRISGFLSFGLLLQTIPFYSLLTYDIVGRLMPELLLPIPIVLLSLMLLKVSMAPDEPITVRQRLIFAAIAGLGMSVKITFLPLWVVPFFLFKGWKSKAKYVGGSILFLFLFAFPIVFDLVFFTGWIRDLFMHSGFYGHGEANVIDVSDFSLHLSEFFDQHPVFDLIYSISLVLTVVHFILLRKTKGTRLTTVQMGLLIAIPVVVVMVCKHFQYRYLVPALALLPIMTIVSLLMLRDITLGRHLKWIAPVLIASGFLWGIPNQADQARIRSVGIQQEVAARKETAGFLSTLPKDAIFLHNPSGYGCPSHSFSMMIVYCWAGKAREIYTPVFQKMYKNHYFYFPWENGKRYWKKYDTHERITNSEKAVYFYTDNYPEEVQDQALQAMMPDYDLENVVRLEKYHNKITNEKVFEIMFNEPVVNVDSLLLPFEDSTVTVHEPE